MRNLKKAIVVASIVSLSISNLNANSFMGQIGDTFHNMFSFSSNDDDKIETNHHKSKKRVFIKKNKIDLKKFCFKDNRSIHFKASEKCKHHHSRKKILVKAHKHSRR